MHRIDTPTAQVDKFGAGKNGFTRGNPQTGVPATALDDDYFDAIQEEIVGVIAATGIVLNKANRTQLLTALKKLFLQPSNNLSEIKTAGAAAIIQTLSNLGLSESASGYVGRLVRVTTFPTSGTMTFNPNTKQAMFKIWGAGQGGGSATAVTSASGGAGGAGGGYVEIVVDIKLLELTAVPITIGSGGAPAILNSGNMGNAGGATSVGSLATANGGANGIGGTCTTGSLVGTIRLTIGQGSQGGAGGGSGTQGGAASGAYGGLPHASGVGDNGGFPAGGAAGGANIGPGNNFIGGRGADGLVIVEEYA